MRLENRQYLEANLPQARKYLQDVNFDPGKFDLKRLYLIMREEFRPNFYEDYENKTWVHNLICDVFTSYERVLRQEKADNSLIIG